MVKINKKEYAWGDISVVVLGRTIAGMTGVEYSAKKTKELRFGAGREPKSVQHGRREYEGTLTLMQSEIIAMNQAAVASGYKDLLDLEVDIVVAYLGDNAIITTNVITCASFSELPRGMKEGDLQSEHALPFVALDIQEI
jgi:hypothetical protein